MSDFSGLPLVIEPSDLLPRLDARDLILVDMYGKQVRQWRGVADNTLQIDNLGTGMYTLKVITRESGEQTTTKIIVSKN